MRGSQSKRLATGHVVSLVCFFCAALAGVDGCARGANQTQVLTGAPAALLGQQKAYLVVYRPADNWPAGQALPEVPRREHSEYLLELYRRGALKFAGRFGDGSGGGMFLSAEDDDAARRIVEHDPAVVAGVFDFDLRPWLLSNWEERAATWPHRPELMAPSGR